MSLAAVHTQSKLPDLDRVPRVDEVGVNERVARFQSRSIKKESKVEALRMVNWVQKDAAELLGISPRVMNYKIKILNIEIPRSRRHNHNSTVGEPVATN